MIDLTQLALALLSIIGGATALLRVVAPLTKNKKDDHTLKYLERFLEVVSFDSKSVEKDTISVNLNR